jgi:hypothetical protein
MEIIFEGSIWTLFFKDNPPLAHILTLVFIRIKPVLINTNGFIININKAIKKRNQNNFSLRSGEFSLVLHT